MIYYDSNRVSTQQWLNEYHLSDNVTEAHRKERRVSGLRLSFGSPT